MVLSNHSDQSSPVAVLNDAFRVTFLGGTVCVTAAVHERGDDFVKAALLAVRGFDDFDTSNDPYGEHDFGVIQMADQTIFWKFDYYDLDLTMRSLDPSEPAITTRVLTIMLADEY